MRPRPGTSRGPASAGTPGAAFTLIEVLLAVVIAVGLLTVVLLFYRQAADLRSQVVVESERMASVRLVMSRLTDEIRTVVPRAGPGVAPLVGNAQALRLIRATVPARTAWTGGDLGRALGADADLVVVRYRAGSGADTPGLFRGEEVLSGTPPPLPPTDPAAGGTNTPPALASDGPVGTVLPPADGATNGPAPAEVLLTDVLPFARFRFWDGAAWQTSWADSRLPAAVEVVLGLELPPLDAAPGTLPESHYRRVITVPAAWGGGVSDTNGPAGGDGLPSDPSDPDLDPAALP